MRALLMLCIIATLSACDKRSEPDCSRFHSALKRGDKESLKLSVADFASRVGRLPANAEFETTRAKLQQLVELINNQCRIEASVICTMCIETLPAQSEIRIIFGNGSSAVLDLYTEPEEFIRMVNLHE